MYILKEDEGREILTEKPHSFVYQNVMPLDLNFILGSLELNQNDKPRISQKLQPFVC